MALSEKDIRYGVWHQWGELALLKQAEVTLPQDYKPRAKLNLWITQTKLSDYQQKKNIDEWCQKLPQLAEVKSLWFPSKVSQKIFDAVCQMPNLETLWIKWSGIKSIDGLANLKTLKHLFIGSSPEVENIDVLGRLTWLETLEIENFKKFSDFSVLENLNGLQGLGVNGSIWTMQKIDTLKPFGGLLNLKYLTFLNNKILDRNFDPILRLKNLVRFDCSWNHPEAEFEKLKSMPNLKYGNVETSWKEIKAGLKKQYE